MKWSLLELRKYHETPLVFEETLNLKDELIRRDDQIIDLSPVKVSGIVTLGREEYILHYTVEVQLTVPSTRSLEPVELPLHFTVDEVFMTPEQFQQRNKQIADEEILILEGQHLNLADSVADNILLAIPMQILSEEERASESLPSGQDWVVISEDQYAQQKEEQAQQIDPRLAKLSELLNKSEDDNS